MSNLTFLDLIDLKSKWGIKKAGMPAFLLRISIDVYWALYLA